MQENELKSCPFCGEQPQTNYFKDKLGSVATIKCINKDCITRDPICVEKINMKLAINAWNTRTSPSDECKKANKCTCIPGLKVKCDYHDIKPSSTTSEVEQMSAHKLSFEITKIFEELRVMHDVPEPVLESLEELINRLHLEKKTLDEKELRKLARQFQDRSKPDGSIDILAFIKAICQTFSAPRVEVSEEDIHNVIKREMDSLNARFRIGNAGTFGLGRMLAKAIKQEIEK